MVERVIYLALPLVGILARTLSPPPRFIEAERGVSRRAPTPMRQTHEAFHAHPDTPYHRRDASWVRRPPPHPIPYRPPVTHGVTPHVLPSCTSNRVSPPPLARLEPCLVASKMVRGPLRGPGSDPRMPKLRHSPTMPPAHLPRRVAPLPFDPYAPLHARPFQ